MFTNKKKGGPLSLVFLSCQPHCGQWTRESHDIQAWASATNGDTYNSCLLRLLSKIKDYKIAMIELRHHNFHLIEKIKKKFPHIKLIGVQEGSLHSPDNEYNTKIRVGYVKAYQNVDALGVLISDSISHFESITDRPVFWLGVPFPVKWAKNHLISPEKKSPLIGFQNTFTSSKGGFTNFFLLKQLQKLNPKLKGFSYNTDYKTENNLAKQFNVNLESKPTKSWQDFFIDHAKAYISIHMDYRWSWNRYSLDCAAAGIPCISTPHTTTHKLLFPKLCVEPFDTKKAIQLALKLLEDKAFYKECREYALEKSEIFNFKNSEERLKNFLRTKGWIN
ncbi:hypothetical protein A2526_05315 [candidate division WOR-1 bacterium RIFOXYD2_FULL_36_8]|uniref:Glycosyl transferase family 1 domain-containing protein n=1 Tax=candidate division WOR-1 bacterium RIFOXYB2_FULL_36_35 TaxID=1802578 RepID=A0A1F4S2Z4_UNCSA|nr:MAG: hypothetical protein A2230_06995 [candidate division WOR-1 bacterium RIFOXYA2_FULL_36_21]OGC14826.1 MAG: hypothetical protein A2290_00830 [candidate division WOR-1 bacterium RIFOXYB2_FULL_36_35]OGC15578.1 MAG: hypothetical protein A2282_09075 [candidate division WOR-1 bacterium RIFOXYA12_FULL_36_13]OGC38509.1 MAG: hypothetical protein A2526_05315 [candidate division WOR-1 bacterium RIFOXYD2_FULL_36_8]